MDVAHLSVLVVDDSPTIRQLTTGILRTIGCTRIVEAENGKDGLDRLRRDGADVVITDWNMPEMDGIELARAIRAEGTWPGIRIIMVTTRGGSDDRIEACLSDVDDYVVKPFTAEDLKETLGRVLG